MSMTSTGLIVAGLAGWLALAPPVMAQTPVHPLVGKVLDTRTGVLVELTDRALVAALFPCNAITLLGEVHDNPEHHQMRGGLLKATASGSQALPANCRRGAFVFEHISADQQAGLEHFYHFDRSAARLATVNDLFRFIEWDKSGWPSQTIFMPLMQEVVRSRRPIVAGSPSKDPVRRIAREGLSALPSEQVRQLGLDQSLDADLNDALLTELEASHCGLMPKTAFRNMAAAQRYKDAYMAEAALKAANGHGSAVMFAGNGHVRTDRGVGAELRRMAPDRTVISVTFAEIIVDKTDPQTYGPRDPAGKPATDYVVFANPAERTDPCEAMRKAMKK